MKKLFYLITLLLITVISAKGQLANGIAAYWNLDETSGSTVNDSYSSNDGTVTNATINQTGILGKAVSFDGSSDYIHCGSDNSLDVGTSDWSFSCWFTITESLYSSSNLYSLYSDGSSTSSGIFICLRGGTSYNGILVRICDGSSYYDFSPTSDIRSMINNGAWHHLAVTIDRDGNLVIYLDDSVQKTQSISSHSAKNFYSSYDHKIGIVSSAYSFNGTLDEIGIWNRALSSDEVSQLNNSGTGLSYPFGTTNSFLTLSSSTMNFSSTAGSNTISLSSSGNWNSGEGLDWLSVSPSTGSSGTTTVTITVTANPNSTERTGTVSFTGPETKSLTVTQAGTGTTQYTLTTSVSPSEGGTVSPGSGTYNSGDVVTVTATPENGYVFSEWDGDLSGSTNPTTINMNSNKSITATFTPVSSTNYWQPATGGISYAGGNVSIGTETPSEYSKLDIQDSFVSGYKVNLYSKNTLTGSMVSGSILSRLSDAWQWSWGGCLLGVTGVLNDVTKLTLNNSTRISNAVGGYFGVYIEDPIKAASIGTYNIAGIKTYIKGTIITYPSNGVVAALYSQDMIQGTNTWAGYFEGKGYFAGNVGIGVDDPQVPLHVKDNIALHGSGLDGSSYQRAQIYANTTLGLYFDAPRDPLGMNLPIQFNWRGGGTPPLYIKGDGNVGIGTSSPTANLHIHSDDENVVPTLKISKPAQMNSYPYVGAWRMELETVLHGEWPGDFVDLVLYHSTDGIQTDVNVKIAQFSNRNNEKQLFIDKITNLTNPQYFLHMGTTGTSLKVAGDIISEKTIMAEKIEVKEIASNNIRTDELKTNSLNVKVENVADYVFSEDYSLRSLEEVDNYITKHKHLPEIPTAKELEKEGMDVAKMNNMLLLKIEELTLYILEQQQEIKSLKQEFYQLKSE